MNKSPLDWALYYASLGWPVFPLHTPITSGGCSCKNKECPHIGKHPRTQNGFKDATTDPKQITKWWGLWPDTNIGIETGQKSNLIVIDIDSKHAGEDSWDEYCKKNEKLPNTPMVLTGGGGVHYYFSYDPAINVSCKVGWLTGVDIRCEDGYVVAPPSRHASGRFYVWEVESEINSVPLAPIPDWLIKELTKNQTTSSKIISASSSSEKIPEGNRNSYLTSRAGVLRRSGFDQIEIESTLLIINQEKCTPPLSENEVKTIAKSCSRYESVTIIDVGEKQKEDWPKIDEIAFHGLAGKFVELIDPSTEADSIAVLVNILIGFGNCVGRAPHFQIEKTRHHLNLFAVLVGNSALGRKGTSWSTPKHILTEIDNTLGDRIVSGLSSGEGIIHHVRDERFETKIKHDPKTNQEKKENVLADPGVQDKRLLIVEEEFSQALRVMKREGNTLSPILRNAWDSKSLQCLSKNSKEKCAFPHVSIIGHITRLELIKLLADVDVFNGFANRFLWVLVKKSKNLPIPPPIGEGGLISLISQLKDVLKYVKTQFLFSRSSDADNLWKIIYNETNAEEPGILGVLNARAAPQILRLACIYALFDKSAAIHPIHLKAAHALWNYSKASAKIIFGTSTGDAIADIILEELSECAPQGLTSTQITKLFNGHKMVGVKATLTRLLKEGMIYVEKTQTEGAPQKKWFYVSKDDAAK